MPNRIYLDNAATTPLSEEVLSVMLPALREQWGNASGVYTTGREAHHLLDRARRQAAAALGADRNELYFTSGGTESDNWALTSVALAAGPGAHLITTAIEHEAVLNTCRWLETQGIRVTYLPVDATGLVAPEALEAAITPQTVLVSIMAANNEVGTVEPIPELAAVAHRHGILFHTDAVQAMGSLPVDVGQWQVDLLSLSGHKLHGPKGSGLLYVRSGVKLAPFLHGGQQERRLRAGTENTAAIAGLGVALEQAVVHREAHVRHVAALAERMRDQLRRIPGIRFNGHPTLRLPGHVHLTLPGVDGEALLLRLDLAGVAASAGSACTSGSVDPSHVLTAIGLGEADARSSLRFSIGDQNTPEEIDEAVASFTAIVAELRRMSGRQIV